MCSWTAWKSSAIVVYCLGTRLLLQQWPARLKTLAYEFLVYILGEGSSSTYYSEKPKLADTNEPCKHSYRERALGKGSTTC